MEFEIIKSHRNGSRSIDNPKTIEDTAEALKEWFWAKNGSFKGNHGSGYALHHTQVSSEPLNFFVVNKSLVFTPETVVTNPRCTLKSFFFESAIIYNPVIVDTPEMYTVTVPKRNVTRVGGEAKIEITKEDKEVPNTMMMMEGCLSFPYRVGKNTKRYFEITVQYEIIRDGKVIKMFEKIDGLKSHIFQHEVEHSRGENMYFKS